MATATTLFWPKSAHSNLKIERIEQITYTIRKNDDDDALINVWAFNTYTPSMPSYYWRTMPAFYEVALCRAFHRMTLLFKALRLSDMDSSTKVLINKNIVYLDRMLDDTWKAALKDEDNVTSEWRSQTLDRWMVIECVVGQHDPECVQNASGLDQNADDLDWSEYENRTDYIIRGDQYKYDFANLKIRPDVLANFVARWVKDITETSDEIRGVNKDVSSQSHSKGKSKRTLTAITGGNISTQGNVINDSSDSDGETEKKKLAAKKGKTMKNVKEEYVEMKDEDDIEAEKGKKSKSSKKKMSKAALETNDTTEEANDVMKEETTKDNVSKDKRKVVVEKERQETRVVKEKKPPIASRSSERLKKPVALSVGNISQSVSHKGSPLVVSTAATTVASSSIPAVNSVQSDIDGESELTDITDTDDD